MKSSCDSIRSKALLLVFGFSLFLSAFLMFLLQPMIGKMLLPLVGGTPAGWIVAMAFFQSALLGGYLLAHLLTRLSVRGHALSYLALLGAGIFFLPVSLQNASLLNGISPTAPGIFLLLSATVAVPFMALAATSSTLQRLFMTAGHHTSHDPYYLYGASNLGSFAGLIAYPLAVEPFFALSGQAQDWLYGYLLLIAAGALCLIAAGREEAAKAAPLPISATPVTSRQRLLWIALAFVPSSLMLGVTTHITTDIFSAPMVWVLPLGLYLLTFVIAFSRKPFIPMRLISGIQPPVVAMAFAFMMILAGVARFSWQAMAWHLIAFAVTALMCHLRLAQSRPLGNDRALTEFYLWLAVGGALGGLLNAFIAPVLFDTLAEYPVVLLASCALNPGFSRKLSNRHILLYLAGCALMIAYGVVYRGGFSTEFVQNAFLAAIFIMVAFHPRATIIACVALFALTSTVLETDKTVLRERNFYGVIKVYDTAGGDARPPLGIRFMKHGTTVHGLQVQTPELETTPTSYFTEKGPIGDIFSYYAPKDIAVMGLGAGTLNCYATPERAFTFLEIDPAVVDVAGNYFTFLGKCKGKTAPRIIVGDGRLELARLKDEKFNLIILDAFSSDMVPTHLLTREAMQMYGQHLTPGGLMLFNISNRFFNLENVIAGTAESLGLHSRFILDATTTEPYAYVSKWIVVSADENVLLPLEAVGWEKVDTMKSMLRPWTDDHTDFLHAIAF